MIALIQLFFGWLFRFPKFLIYHLYDKICYYYYNLFKNFYGWGIHLYTGKFGQGKTCGMVIRAYKLCIKYPQLHVLTNMQLTNFPKHTQILPLHTAKDILNAPQDTIVIIDEIGTIFNSRDFSSGKNAVPKPLFQHLCQCRHRRMMILATVQRFNLLDKQIRDITATVTSCSTSFKHPFSRMVTLKQFDIDEYEQYAQNIAYHPRIQGVTMYIQTNQYRHLYDTTEMVNGMLDKDYLSDKEILENRGETGGSIFGDKETRKAIKHRSKV